MPGASPPPDKPSYDDLEREVGRLGREVETLKKQLADVLKALDEARRAGKRQAAPFSKGKPKPDPKPPGRKPGDDYGERFARATPSHLDETLEAELPAFCPCCDGLLEETEVVDQFQTEIPEIRPFERRFRVHVGRCTRCRRRVQGRHALQTSDALGAAAVQIGPNALGFASVLNKQLGASWEKIARIFRHVFAFTVGSSTLYRGAARLSKKVEPEYEDMRTAVRHALVANADETGWKIAGETAWLWVVVTPWLTVYRVVASRGGDVVLDLFGADWSGLLCRDGYAPYRQLTHATHQSCLAHHLARAKEILVLADRGAARFPHAVIGILKAALDLRDRREEVSAHGFAVARGRIEARLDRLLAWEPTYEPNATFVKHLRRERPALLTFLHHPEVDASNWRGEQGIRPAVITRKLCGGGNRTPAGARVQEVLTSILTTCARQGRDALALFVAALRARAPITLGLASGPPRLAMSAG